MYIQVFYMSLGWFDSTEPSRTTLSLREQGVQGTYTLVYTPVVLEFSKICSQSPLLTDYLLLKTGFSLL